MEISQAGIDLIKQFEGFSAKPYLCPAGKLTIGYGHVIVSGESFSKAGIAISYAENLLKQDVGRVGNAVSGMALVALSQNQFDALCSLAYNIGIKAFEKSTLLRYINDGKPELAAGEFLRWVYAGGVVVSGLMRRRLAEKAMFSANNTEL